MPTIFVIEGPDKGRSYDLPLEPVVIGRTSDQFPLSDFSTSRRHAELRAENGFWLLTDLDSSNGTYVNGQRVVQTTRLKHGDRIKVGGTVLAFSNMGHPDNSCKTDLIPDLIGLDAGEDASFSSIVSTVDEPGQSVILQSPETADAVTAWTIMNKVAEAIGMSPKTNFLLERVSDILFDHLVVDSLALLMFKGAPAKLVPQVVRCRAKDRGHPPKVFTSRSIIDHVLEKREGVLSANAMSDGRFTRENQEDSIHRLGLRSIICVPMLVRGEVVGVIHLDCSMSRHVYTQDQLGLCQAIGRLTGVALDNARLLESRMRNERLAAIGETVAYLSHHIRNILQGMQGGAEVVELGFKKQSLEKAQSGWALIKRNLDRTLHLAMNMLTFSKDRQPLIELASLNRIVEDAMALAQNRANEKSVTIFSELEEMPPVPLDADGIHQVTHNILRNAIEAVASPGGKVNVSTRYDASSGGATLTIRDNGPGIPPADRERIFDVFHSSKGHAGTGLGLAAAKKIVTELGGRIVVESTVHEGTAFHVILPGTLHLAVSNGSLSGPTVKVD
ncbi:MAG: ATP-binding protein [Planctomycetota bacterium]